VGEGRSPQINRIDPVGARLASGLLYRTRRNALSGFVARQIGHDLDALSNAGRFITPGEFHFHEVQHLFAFGNIKLESIVRASNFFDFERFFTTNQQSFADCFARLGRSQADGGG